MLAYKQCSLKVGFGDLNVHCAQAAKNVFRKGMKNFRRWYFAFEKQTSLKGDNIIQNNQRYFLMIGFGDEHHLY